MELIKKYSSNLEKIFLNKLKKLTFQFRTKE
jgi:hypothetical protein